MPSFRLTFSRGVEISGPFANLPPRDLKDYYQVIKKPASLRSIQKKVRGQKGREKASGQSLFTSWQTLEEELALIWNNARQYNEEGSEIYTAAGELEVGLNMKMSDENSSRLGSLSQTTRASEGFGSGTCPT